MKTRYIYYPLLMLLAILLPTSCSVDDDIDVNPNTVGEKVRFNIGVSLAGTSDVESRAFGHETYNFDNLHVAVFDVETGYLKEFVEATPNKTNDTDNCWNFDVTLTTLETACRLHLIANYLDLTMGFSEEGQLMGLLQTDANNNEHDVYWNFVELNSLDESSASQLQHVPLVRNYAKVQLTLADNLDENFDFIAYALYNVPTKGTVAAYNASSTNNKFPQFVVDGTIQTYAQLTTAGYLGHEAYNDGSLYTNVWMPDESTEPYYMYERKNQGVDNPTCMIIKATYGGEETYYKLDFVNSEGDYYNLLRNFVYTMSVTAVTGAGYSSIDEALRQPACNNISGSAVAQDFTNVSDGTHQLFVSSTFVLFTQQKTVELYYKYISNLSNSTIANASVDIDGDGEGTVLSSSTIATADEGNNSQYPGWRKITLTSKAPLPSSTTQELVFKADGLQRKVTLMLNQPYQGMTVNVYDGENNPIDKDDNVVSKYSGKKVMVDITLPVIPESLFPLRLFISSAGNTIYPQYGSNMPAEARDGVYGFIKEVSYSDAYEITSDADGKQVVTPKIIVCEFLTNCTNNQTTVYVDNDYLARGSDSFENENGGGSTGGGTTDGSITIPKDRTVTIGLSNDRYPQSIDNTSDNNASSRNNNGEVNAIITLNGVTVGTVTIKASKNGNSTTLKVKDNAILTYSNGFDSTDRLTFTINDKRWSRSQQNWVDETWTETLTVEQILSGNTLAFERS